MQQDKVFATPHFQPRLLDKTTRKGGLVMTSTQRMHVVGVVLAFVFVTAIVVGAL